MMSTFSQKEAVVNEVHAILGSNFDPSIPAKEQLTSEHIATIKANVVAGIINGSVAFNKDTTDEKEIARYVSGMVSNHFRKAKELNGGNTYTPQSTGRGSRDSQISELNKLLKTLDEGSEGYNEVVAAINHRKQELAVEKAAMVAEKRKQKELESINPEFLPDNLRELASTLVSDNA
jgi:hypothetical protein